MPDGIVVYYSGFQASSPLRALVFCRQLHLALGSASCGLDCLMTLWLWVFMTDHIFHATVANLYRVFLIEYLIKFVPLWKVFLYQFQEFPPYVGPYVCAVWWVKPCDISVSVFPFLLFSVFLRLSVLSSRNRRFAGLQALSHWPGD